MINVAPALHLSNVQQAFKNLSVYLKVDVNRNFIKGGGM